MASEPGIVSSRAPNYNCLYNIRTFCPTRVFSLMPRYFLSLPNTCSKPTLLMPGWRFVGNEHAGWETGETPKGLRWCQGTWHPWNHEGMGCAIYKVHTAIDTDDLKNICAWINCKYVWLPNIHRDKYVHINGLHVQMHLNQTNCRNCPCALASAILAFCCLCTALYYTTTASDSLISNQKQGWLWEEARGHEHHKKADRSPCKTQNEEKTCSSLGTGREKKLITEWTTSREGRTLDRERMGCLGGAARSQLLRNYLACGEGPSRTSAAGGWKVISNYRKHILRCARQLKGSEFGVGREASGSCKLSPRHLGHVQS